ncbi:unnamed protein product, partial [marine sediment metagenome]
MLLGGKITEIGLEGYIAYRVDKKQGEPDIEGNKQPPEFYYKLAERPGEIFEHLNQNLFQFLFFN